MSQVNKEEKALRDSLSSILQGYSVVQNGGQKLFIKHFGFCDAIESDFQYQIAFRDCINRGIFTEEQKIQLAIKNKFWSNEEDKEISILKLSINNLQIQKGKTVLPSQKSNLNKEIEEKNIRLFDLEKKRNNIIGTTAESIATQRAEDYYIFKSFYLDYKLEKPFKDEEEFNSTDEEEIKELKYNYFSCLNFILNGNIKKIALSNQFMSLLYLTDNFYYILGKPLANYTYYQMDLISYGKMYKSILNMEPKPPENIRHDPEKLEEWLELATSKKIITKNDSSGQVIMGATDSDIKELFKNEEVVNIDTEIKKRGRMNMAELMKLHGV